MPRLFRIPKRELDLAAREERKEHPWMTHRQAVHTARDHLVRHPTYQKAMGVAEHIMERQERGMKPIRRKRRPASDAFIHSDFPF